MNGARSSAAKGANVCLWPTKKRVMPAKAGFHDFLAAPGPSAFVTLTEKSWMPAFAGMTRERAGGGRNPFIRDFNRMAYIFLLFKKSTPFFLPPRGFTQR